MHTLLPKVVPFDTVLPELTIEHLRAENAYLLRMLREIARDVYGQHALLAGADLEHLSLMPTVLPTIDAVLMNADRLAGGPMFALWEAAIAWRAAIAIPDGVVAAEDGLLAALTKLEQRHGRCPKERTA